MAIKKLQNNFTTPEQSKRLSELGVPINTADCYYNTDGENIGVLPDNTTFEEFNKSIKRVLCKELSPCWSVGRLMEIYGICMGIEGFFYCKGNFIDEAIRRIKYSVKKNWLDFSNLED